MRRVAAVLTASMLAAGCTGLAPQQAAPLISDEAAGSRNLYLTGDSDLQETLERIAARTTSYIAEYGLESIDSDLLNVKMLDTVFVSGYRGTVEFGMPGNGAASIAVHEGGVNMAMTGDLMVCWGIRVAEDGDILKTGIFNPPCEADGLKNAAWQADWPERPEPDTSPDGFEFGVPPPAR